MNILYLCNHLNVGGITSYILTLAAGMKARGHTVTVASAGGQMEGEFISAGIRLLRLPIKLKQELHPRLVLSACRAAVFVKRNKIDIVHSQTRTTHVAGALIRALTGIPQVTTCHGFYKVRLSRRLFPFRGNATIAISEPVKKHLIEDLRADKQNITVIYNGIDVERFLKCPNRTEVRQGLALGGDPAVGVVARLADVKGHKHLIEAMGDVVKVFPRARLLIVGEGKMKGDLERWTANLNLADNVRFIPSVSDTRDVLCALDVFVLPSLSEGLGIALMEAMAAGCASIGSRVGGIMNLIEHEYNGLLVEPGNARQLAAAIIRLLSDENERRELGAAARRTARQKFSQTLMVVQTQEVYQRCLSEKR